MTNASCPQAGLHAHVLKGGPRLAHHQTQRQSRLDACNLLKDSEKPEPTACSNFQFSPPKIPHGFHPDTLRSSCEMVVTMTTICRDSFIPIFLSHHLVYMFLHIVQISKAKKINCLACFPQWVSKIKVSLCRRLCRQNWSHGLSDVRRIHTSLNVHLLRS